MPHRKTTTPGWEELAPRDHGRRCMRDSAGSCVRMNMPWRGGLLPFYPTLVQRLCRIRARRRCLL